MTNSLKIQITPWYKVECHDYYKAVEAPFPFRKDIPNPPGVTGEYWPDCVKLKENQTIEVKLKNGAITNFKLHITRGQETAQIDMNNIPDYFVAQKLYAKVPYCGEILLLPLKGKWIRRVDI